MNTNTTNSIHCPECNAGSKVIKTHRIEGGIRRRRECVNYGCQWRWTTLEVLRSRVKQIEALEAVVRRMADQRA